MADNAALGFGEFLADIRYVITCPARRFPVILERGALWGSILLLIAPAYFVFSFAGGVFFDRDPFPGYSFLLPAILAALAQIIKGYCIHIFERLFEGRWHYSAATGRFRSMLTVFGYSMVPGGLAVIIATVLFLMFPIQIGEAVRNYRVITISLLVALGTGLFLWNLILLVLALRPVYPMRDFKIVLALLIGHVVGGIPAGATAFVAQPVEVQFTFLQPIISPRILAFLSAGPERGSPREDRITIHTDRIVYRFKHPRLFDLVAYAPSKTKTDEETSEGSVTIYGKVSEFSRDKKNQAAGRIVGLPGDSVELVQGKLKINGQSWAEPYIPAEFQSTASLSQKHLGPSEYLVLPEDRRLVGLETRDWIVGKNEITGKILVVRWPLGWAIFRPTAFLHAYPCQ